MMRLRIALGLCEKRKGYENINISINTSDAGVDKVSNKIFHNMAPVNVFVQVGEGLKVRNKIRLVN